MKLASTLAAAVLTLGIAACGDSDDDSSGDDGGKLRIGLEAPSPVICRPWARGC
jgi:hypothetical protein